MNLALQQSKIHNPFERDNGIRLTQAANRMHGKQTYDAKVKNMR